MSGSGDDSRPKASFSLSMLPNPAHPAKKIREVIIATAGNFQVFTLLFILYVVNLQILDKTTQSGDTLSY